MRVDIPVNSNCCSEPVFYAAIEEDCTSDLIIEVCYVVLLHG